MLQLGRVEDAKQIAADAAGLGAGVADAYDALAFVSMALGRHERANALYLHATELAPRDPRFSYNLACSERGLGRLDGAEAACDRWLALDDTQYASWLLRSEMRVQSADANLIGELEARIARADADYRARVLLGYALAKELDDVGRYEEAFRRFDEAARTRRARLAYDVATDEGKRARIAEIYRGHLSSSPAGAAPGTCSSGWRPRTPTLWRRIMRSSPILALLPNASSRNCRSITSISAPFGTPCRRRISCCSVDRLWSAICQLRCDWCLEQTATTRLPNIPSESSRAGQRITGTIGGRGAVERAVNAYLVEISLKAFELPMKIERIPVETRP